MDLLLQKTLFNLFNDRLTFAFYDGLSNQGFPYGTFSYSNDILLNTKTTKGNKITYQIDLFSDYNGQKEVKEMAEQVTTLIGDCINLENGRIAYMSEYTKQIQREDDIYHGILEVTFEIY